MQLIFKDKQKREIKEKAEITFSSFSSYHLIEISARAKSEKQLGKNATDDEDLTTQVDDKTFPQRNSGRRKDSPAAFSGGKLHNIAKTVYFLTLLEGKSHTITLETDEEPNTATLESLQVYTANLLDKTLTLEINQQAEDGDRRPWITFVLDQLPLKSITPTITFSRRKRDSDDVKVIIDGKTQANLLRNIKHFLWRFVGSLLPPFSSKTEVATFTVNLPQGLHYIELEADRMPTLEKIIFDFGKTPPIPKRTPTVNNPKWTGSFADDTAQLILARALFGEARNTLVPDQARVAIGWVIKNRVKSNRWANSYWEVITKPWQFSSFNTGDDNRPYVENPLHTGKEIDKKAWEHAYEIAGKVISNEFSDPTNGANHYYDDSISVPDWAKNQKPTLIVTYVNENGENASILFFKL